MSAYYITQEGYIKLKNDLDNMKNVERPKIISALASSRALGDLRENAEYHAAKQRQSYIESQILYLEDLYQKAIVIDSSQFENDIVKFGAKVKLLNIENDKILYFNIVGQYEADLSKGYVSVESPIGISLIGKKVGDVIEVPAPRGSVSYEVLSIEFNQ
jgi:transcription elongation factor GreA